MTYPTNHNHCHTALTYNHGSIILLIILPTHDLLRHHTLTTLLNHAILPLPLLPLHRCIHNDHRRCIHPHLFILIISDRYKSKISTLLPFLHDLIVFDHHVDKDILQGTVSYRDVSHPQLLFHTVHLDEDLGDLE